MIPQRRSASILAGFVVGQLIVVVIDAVLHGPGPFVLFGV